MKKFVVALVAFLAIASAGSLFAQTATDASPSPPIGTQVPLVLGEVMGTTSHSVTVRTARDEQILFEYDSRTVMPMNLMSGRRVKVEFDLMGNGEHHAGRITPLEPGSLDWERLNKQLAMAERERQMDEGAMAANASNREREDENRYANNQRANHEEKNMNNEESAREEARETPAQERAEERAEHHDELPRTASFEPWLLIAGLLAVAVGFGIRYARRRRTA